MDGHMDSFGTQQQQQQRSSSSSGGSVRVLLLAWADSTRLPRTYYTVYSTIGRFKIHCSSIIGSLACRTPLPLG